MKNSNVKASVYDGQLVLILPLRELAPSKSGKSLLLATSSGSARTDLTVNGEAVYINVSAWTYPPRVPASRSAKTAEETPDGTTE